MFYFPQGLLCVPAEDKMTQKTLKYRMLLKAFRMLPVKRIMAGTPEKTQKIFKKAYKGVEIPELHDPEISVSRGEVKGQAVLYYRHRKETDRVGIYLVGGGMLNGPPSQGKEADRTYQCIRAVHGLHLCGAGGAVPMEEWTTYRLTGDTLLEMAK